MSKDQISSCELFDLRNTLTMINKFPEPQIYETDTTRSYILVDQDVNYRLELNTSLEGVLRDFIVVNFDGENGVAQLIVVEGNA